MPYALQSAAGQQPEMIPADHMTVTAAGGLVFSNGPKDSAKIVLVIAPHAYHRAAPVDEAPKPDKPVAKRVARKKRA